MSDYNSDTMSVELDDMSQLDSSAVRVSLPAAPPLPAVNNERGVSFSKGKVRPKLYAAQDDYVAPEEVEGLKVATQSEHDPVYPGRPRSESGKSASSERSGGGSSIIARAFKNNPLKLWWHKIPLMYKMGVIVGIPTIGLIVLTSLMFVDETKKMTDVEMDEQLTFFIELCEKLLRETQLERGLTKLAILLPDDLSYHRDLMDQRENGTNPARENLIDFVDEGNLDGAPYLAASDQLDNMLRLAVGLETERSLVDSGKLSFEDAEEFYNDLNEAMLECLQFAVTEAADATVKDFLQIISLSSVLSEEMDHERFLGLQFILATPHIPEEDYIDYVEDMAHVKGHEQSMYWSRTALRTVSTDIMVYTRTEEHEEKMQIALEARESYRNIFSHNDTDAILALDWSIFYGNMTFLIDDLELERKSYILAIEMHSSESLASASEARISLTIVLVVVLLTSCTLMWLLIGSIRVANRILADEVKRRRTTEKAIWRFFPIEFMQLLNRTDVLNIQAGEKRRMKMCVMFADIRNFTGVSEQLGGEQTYDWLMDYVQRMGPIVKNHNGFIDKVLGDGIMALFLESQDALDCAVAMQIESEKMNLDNLGSDLPEYNVGIGLHTGDVIVGVIGDSHRLEGTTVSDTVNTASRIEGLCKYYQSKIVISGTTYDECDMDSIGHRFLGSVRCVGKRTPVRVFDIYEADRRDIRTFKESTRGAFENSIRAYQEGRFEDCEKDIEEVISTIPSFSDGGALRRKALCDELKRNGKPENWLGEDVMSSK